MSRPLVVIALATLFSGCGASKGAPLTTAPAPVQSAPAAAPAPTPAAAPPNVEAPPAEAPPNWQLLDAEGDRVIGTGVLRAKRELLAGRSPGRTVLVAVIDGGVDTSHAALRDMLWRNPKEVAGNGKDDDGNGYTDDVYGWNFIGGKDGRDVNWDTIELTRVYAACTATPSAMPADTSIHCADIKTKFEEKQKEAQQQLTQVTMVEGMLGRTRRILALALGGDTGVTVKRVQALPQTTDSTGAARQMFLRLAGSGITQQAIDEAKVDVGGTLKYGLNPAFNPREVVGDNPANPNERNYGNRDVMGPDAKHGTHVSGIIGAVRGSNSVEGVASSVRIMMVRTVPNGDERDKDVANAIRYAVDNGAQVINMSFGKGFSPNKDLVDAAVKYADSKGVLMVHSAGNDGEDLSQSPSFPTPRYRGGGKALNWIEVGASSWQGQEKLAATFSNYGEKEVDLFAPGVDILSTIPGGGFERESGTSMAAPVVTGVAALLMSYFPKLTAADIKKLILDSATRYSDVMVARPGSPDGEKVRFGALSSTGGVVNAYAAVKAALASSGAVQ
ncbi:MAG: S8 family peptidase [Gemmatimonadaceae bacterium]